MLALAAVAVVLFLVGRGDDATPEETTVAPTTTEFVVVTSPPAEGFQTPVESGGLTVTPTDPLTEFGVTCVVWQLAGAAPLTFDPVAVELEAAGTVFRDDAAVRTGRGARHDRPGGDRDHCRDLLPDRRCRDRELRCLPPLHPAGHDGHHALPVERRHAVTGGSPLP